MTRIGGANPATSDSKNPRGIDRKCDVVFWQYTRLGEPIMAPQTAIILFAGWLVGAMALATLPRARSMLWKVTAIFALLVAFLIEGAVLHWYYPAAH